MLVLPLTACNSVPPAAGTARNGPPGDLRDREREAYPRSDRSEPGERRERRAERREERRGDGSYGEGGFGGGSADGASREEGGNQARSGRERGNRNHATSAAGFDFYLLNLSWSPEFCHGHPDAPECAAHAHFVLHGLWPQNADGTYPDRCSDAPGPADPGRYSALYPSQSLLEHEWQSHGTCSGLSPDAYFGAATTAVRSVVIPPTLARLAAPTTMPPDQILGLFAESNPAIPRTSLALSCGNNYLTAVEVCLDKSLHPVACSGVRSCRANAVRIATP